MEIIYVAFELCNRLSTSSKVISVVTGKKKKNMVLMMNGWCHYEYNYYYITFNENQFSSEK